LGQTHFQIRMMVPVEAGGQSIAILEFGFRVVIFCYL
jgi:hypothetical protein